VVDLVAEAVRLEEFLSLLTDFGSVLARRVLLLKFVGALASTFLWRPFRTKSWLSAVPFPWNCCPVPQSASALA
jgi:hypothetical protein